MSQLNFTLTLDQFTLEKFGAELTEELRGEIRKRLLPALPALQNQCRQTVIEELAKSQHVDSIRRGELREELGLADPDYALDGIIAAVGDSVRVRLIERSGNTLGGVEVYVVQNVIGNVLNTPYGEYISTNKKGNSTTIEWLRWLLLEGTAIEVVGAEIYKGRANFRNSRSGTAIMIRRKRGSKGWGVPPRWAGTQENNFITHALEDAMLLLQIHLEDAVAAAI